MREYDVQKVEDMNEHIMILICQSSEVKNLELRAMIADQTVEEMEEQLELALNMSSSTNQKVG